MKKVILIGPSGVGKSTLAADLAEKLSVEHIELDAIYHQENWQPIDKDEFRRIVNEKTKADGWVFCGNYFSTLGIEFWQKADAVIWLDYSFPLVLNRLVKRTFNRVITRQELWNGNKESLVNGFFTKDSVIYFMMSTWNKQKRRYGPIFDNPQGLDGVEMIRLRSPKETKLFLNRQ
jgi:adenylate kinase family enzyme